MSATPTRFHLGLHTADLGRAVRFYRVLLGVEPADHLPDGARFETDQPALVVGLYPGQQPPGGALNHAGLRLPDAAALVAVQRRLEEAGIATQRQEGVECCYARQKKFWVADPDRVLWEVYTLHEDIDHSGFDDPPAPAAAPAPARSAGADSAGDDRNAVWQHRVPDPVPDRIDYPDGALDEVMLEGTFNAAAPPGRVAGLLAEAFRALKPGGKVSVRGLVGDKPFPGAPKLPGMAALVERVPVETEPAAALARAGFGGLFTEKLGDIHCFAANGVELRELRLVGWKPLAGTGSVAVVYKGPFERVSDESGTVYRRGERVSVPAAVAGRLRAGPAADQFAFLAPP